jgi:hypothetical protein
MTYEDEIISQLSREITFLYQNQKDIDKALIDI